MSVHTLPMYLRAVAEQRYVFTCCEHIPGRSVQMGNGLCAHFPTQSTANSVCRLKFIHAAFQAAEARRVSVAEDTALALSISLLLGGLMMKGLISKSQGFTQH